MSKQAGGSVTAAYSSRSCCRLVAMCGKMIKYRHVKRVRSKSDVLISAAGGVDLKEARSAIFNGANIVVANLVRPGDPWRGISTETDVAQMAQQFLATIE